MRIFIAVLVLIFSFQSWTKADDIRDFQIEGMSIGDSALEYFSKDEIEDRKKVGFVYKKKDFYSATFFNKKFYEFYDNVQLHLKKNDNRYIIYSVGGQKKINNYQNKCFKQMDEVLTSIKSFFPKARVLDVGIEDWTSSRNNGTKVKSYYVQLSSKDEISIQCYDHPNSSKEFEDNLLVAIDTKEFAEWLYD